MSKTTKRNPTPTSTAEADAGVAPTVPSIRSAQPEVRRGSSPSASGFWIEIRDTRTGASRQQSLGGASLLIGSATSSDIVLEHASVSATHAELIRGPNGQWWINDRGSAFGTLLHGRPARQELLTVGDEVELGVFRLILRRSGFGAMESPLGTNSAGGPAVQMRSIYPEPPQALRSHRPLAEGESGPAQESSPGTLRGGTYAGINPLHPGGALPAAETSISAIHVSRVMRLSRRLLQTESVSARRRGLCEFVAELGEAVDSAAVLRVSGPHTVRVLEGPVRNAAPNLPLQMSPKLTSAFWGSRRSVCHQMRLRDEQASGQKKSESHVITTCGLLMGDVEADLDYQGEALRGATESRGSRRGGAAQSSGESGCQAYQCWLGSGCHNRVLIPLQVTDDYADALHVGFASSGWNGEGCALLAMVTAVYRHAEYTWDMRTHAHQSSRLESELEMARRLQQSLVPQEKHFDSVNQRLEVAVGFEPCQWVGGDYADAMSMPDGRVLLAVADVCGKGMQAALVASSLHTFVRATIEVGLPLSELMARLNRYMCRYLPDNVFVTMLCMAMSLDTGDIEVVSAGHPPALIGELSGRVWALDVGANVGLGITDTEIVSGHYHLERGQTLLLYTDGLTEAVNEAREHLGVDRLAQMFSKVVSVHDGRDLHVMRDQLLTDLSRFRGSLMANDDMAFLLARRRGENEPPSR